MKSIQSEPLHPIKLSTQTLGSFVDLQKKVVKLKNKTASAKVFTYMVIHDLKHPTESLIDSVKIVFNQLQITQNELAKVEKQNTALTEKLKSLCSQEDLKSWIPLPPIKKIGTQNVLDQESIEIVGEESKKSSNSSKLSLCFSGSDN